MKTLHITAYKFTVLDQLSSLKSSLLSTCQTLNLLGTILLSEEGININLTGSETEIVQFINFIHHYPAFTNLSFKETECENMPYDRLLVKIKPEIITFQQPGLPVTQHSITHLPPQQFREWLDEDKEMVVIDARNDYEVAEGTFEKAIHLNIQQFTDFPKAIESLGDQHKNKCVVIFCTGGVRCEKAGLLMEQLGYQELYQLEGGILNYFKQCGNAHYLGECFVFDNRISITNEACCDISNII